MAVGLAGGGHRGLGGALAWGLLLMGSLLAPRQAELIFVRTAGLRKECPQMDFPLRLSELGT